MKVFEMLARDRWADTDFGYHVDYDFFYETQHIVRSDGATLYNVSVFNSGAQYSVHFCVESREIWAVNLAALRKVIEFEEKFVRYAPSKKSAGLPTARGYVLPCSLIAEVGHCFRGAPAKLFDRLSKAKNKSDLGILAEKAFVWLVNDKRFFPTIFVGEATRCSLAEDYYDGLDFWINREIPVQVKVDGPGGTGTAGTGNLFFQTHTLPLRQCEQWYAFQKEERT